MVDRSSLMRLSILDTTLLSNFAHAGRPDLLQLALGETAVTTATVLTELRQGEAAGLVPRQEWSWLPQTDLTPAEMALAAGYRNIVDAGEADCLAVAVTRSGRFLSDDMAARRLAQAEGVPVSGTIGVLLHLIEQQHLTLSAADALLVQMRQAGYRAPVSTLQRLLDAK
jgi:predicted nucleic acid-binding protein